MNKCLILIYSLTFLFIKIEAIENPSVIFLQPNTTPLFTELYDAYGFKNPPKKTFFDEAIYLDQSSPVKIVPMQPSNQVVFKEASTVLAEFHKSVGDLELYIDPQKKEPFFYTASGSKHLIVALVYAIVTTEPNKKFVFAEQAPFYSGHPSAVSGIFHYSNARFLSFHDVKDIKLEEGEELIEFVTSPNNPDGKFRKPVTNAKTLIVDFVFASSSFGSDETGYMQENIAWIRDARREGKHIFSFNSASKQFGRTGDRCGYIWYPLYDSYAESIFKNFFGFISASTVAAGTTGLANFLDLIKAFNEEPEKTALLRQDAKKTLFQRHALVEKEFLRRYPNSLVLSIKGSPTFFVKMVDPRIQDKKASDLLFEDLKISVNSGDTMGETKDFIRLNLSGDSSQLAEFLNRLAGGDKYSKQDVLIIDTACNIFK